MAIIDALASGDELTATECAELTGLSPSATAYHLKFLERYDLAEPAPARRTDGSGHGGRPPAGRRSSSTLRLRPVRRRRPPLGLALLDSSRAVAEEFVATGSEEPEEWRDVASLLNADLWLTVEETRKP